MRFVRFLCKEGPLYGVTEGDIVRQLDGSPFGDYRISEIVHHLSELEILSPCEPSKVIGVGLNYRDHIAEIGKDIPEEPLIFIKASTAVVGQGANIIYPRVTQKVGFEAELGVVIGRQAKDVTEEESLGYVLGYTCLNDVSARDIQRKEQHWTRAKSFDTFCPMGPFLVTGIDPGNLQIKSYLNGEIRQSSTTAHLVFNVQKLVSFISQSMTMLPGDVIATGTPGNAGLMQPGDIIEVEIEKVGRLKNTLVSA